ncbi:5-methylcytosine rRNA methyltransferase NSUN4 [Hypsibius exemplaris]|uniref:NOL1/NOP2/Sun domain family member 4 n=1 Tax=Hypsibius exemplaris TaxID=2072580 RepID=A0A1W0WM07_HYPEX|nr:5-methylcytosine rRNA methyltransferase NSUN4 [Hypsibius exemplaris]
MVLHDKSTILRFASNISSCLRRKGLCTVEERFAVPQRYRHKAKWSNENTRKKPTQEALGILDGVYGNGVYAKSWKSARLALLGTQKYCAVLNNYSGNFDKMDLFMRELGALQINDYMRPVTRKKPAVIHISTEEEPAHQIDQSTDGAYGTASSPSIHQSSDEFGNYSETKRTSQSSGRSTAAPQEDESERDLSGFDLAKKLRILSGTPDHAVPEPAVEYEEKPEFMPASKVIHEEVEQEERLIEPIRSAVSASERLPLLADSDFPEVPQFLKVYAFPRGDISRFPRPQRDLSGFGDYYLMDGASLLPVLALGLKLGDRVLDMCAAPGGKSVAMLQTMLPAQLVCSDISGSRLGRLQRVLKTFCPMDLPELQAMVQTIHRDGANQSWYEEKPYDKILVDAPCTNDRVSLTVEENNMFTSRRAGERNRLPEQQLELLMAACKNVEIGGSVVYSTCSLSPIQNDGVVHLTVLELLREGVNMAIIDTRPFVEAFRGIYRFHHGEDTSYGQTILPHIASNFGPMYFSKLKRLA